MRFVFSYLGNIAYLFEILLSFCMAAGCMFASLVLSAPFYVWFSPLACLALTTSVCVWLRPLMSLALGGVGMPLFDAWLHLGLNLDG